MGTHPIFESDFDCLTDKRLEMKNILFCITTLVKSSEIVKRDTLAQLTCDNLRFTDESKKYFEANCTSPTIIDDIKDLLKADTTSKLIIPGLECQCGDDSSKTEPCIGMCYKLTDIPASQMWAVSFFFINLVLAVAIVILWGSDTTAKSRLTTSLFSRFLFFVRF